MNRLTPEQQKQVEALLERAVAIDGAARTALIRACHDRDVRAEVESLLAARPLAERMLNEPLAYGERLFDALLSDTSLGDADAETDDAPDTIGSYRILSKLGAGGMGRVYLAEQHEPLHRRVAIKLIKLGMDTNSVLRRFETERQALALMDHPHVARVLDAGATSDGRPYFVMELVDGVRITSFCDGRCLDTAARLRLFLQVCYATQHAHQKGVIHRDIKPSNVLVSQSNGAPTAKIIDFGVAKATGGRLGDQTLLTEHGMLIGTPEYMSPEQADPAGTDVDTRTDVYALGVLLYEMLVGATPLDVSSSVAVGFDDIRLRIRETDPLRPSTRVSSLGEAAHTAARHRGTTVAGLQRQLRGDLDWIALKCLEKDRERRYATVGDLIDDIERFARHEPVSAGPPSMTYRARKFARRHRAMVAGVTAVAITLIAGLISTAVFAARESRQRAAAETQAVIAQATNDFLRGMLASVKPQRVGDRDVRVKEVLDAAAHRIETELVDQPEVQAAVRLTIGDAYLRLGELERAGGHLQYALETRESLLGEDHPDVLEAMDRYATWLQATGAYDQAEARFRTVLERRITIDPDNAAAIATAQRHLGMLLKAGGRLDEAEALFREAHQGLRRQYGERDLQTVSALTHVATMLRDRGQLDDAARLLRDALDARRAELGDDHLDTINTASDLASVMLDQGRFAEAEPLVRDAVTGFQRALGDDHPDTLTARNNLAGVLQQTGRLEEAEPLLEDVLRSRRAKLGPDHPDVAASVNNLAGTVRRRGDLERAEALYREAVDLSRASLGPQHPLVAAALNNLAFVLKLRGDLAGAERFLRESLEVQQAVLGENHPRYISGLKNLASLSEARGDLEQARAGFARVLKLSHDALGDEHPMTGDARVNLARCLRELAAYEEAESLLLTALESARSRLGDDSADVRTLRDELIALYEAWGRMTEAEP